MTRAALRKPQHDLFAAGPASCMLVQAQKLMAAELHLHPCEAPCCDAWDAFGTGVFREVAGTWWCAKHRPAEATPA